MAHLDKAFSLIHRIQWISNYTIANDYSLTVDVHLCRIFMNNNVFIYHVEQFFHSPMYCGTTQSSTLMRFCVCLLICEAKKILCLDCRMLSFVILTGHTVAAISTKTKTLRKVLPTDLRHTYQSNSILTLRNPHFNHC